MEYTPLGDQAIRVALSGRLDTNAIARIEPQFRSLLANCGAHVLVDLREVGFAASMAIRMFVANARVLQGCGRQMVLYGAQPLVLEIFGHVALNDLIPIVEDEPAALHFAACAAGNTR